MLQISQQVGHGKIGQRISGHLVDPARLVNGLDPGLFGETPTELIQHQNRAALVLAQALNGFQTGIEQFLAPLHGVHFIDDLLQTCQLSLETGLLDFQTADGLPVYPPQSHHTKHHHPGQGGEYIELLT